jgi:hypothetical protein
MVLWRRSKIQTTSIHPATLSRRSPVIRIKDLLMLCSSHPPKSKATILKKMSFLTVKALSSQIHMKKILRAPNQLWSKWHALRRFSLNSGVLPLPLRVNRSKEVLSILIRMLEIHPIRIYTHNHLKNSNIKWKKFSNQMKKKIISRTLRMASQYSAQVCLRNKNLPSKQMRVFLARLTSAQIWGSLLSSAPSPWWEVTRNLGDPKAQSLPWITLYLNK